MKLSINEIIHFFFISDYFFSLIQIKLPSPPSRTRGGFSVSLFSGSFFSDSPPLFDDKSFSLFFGDFSFSQYFMTFFT